MRARELVTDLGPNTSEYGEWLDGPVLAQELRGFKHTGDGLFGPLTMLPLTKCLTSKSAQEMHLGFSGGRLEAVTTKGTVQL